VFFKPERIALRNSVISPDLDEKTAAFIKVLTEF